MTEYQQRYTERTKQPAPKNASMLEPLFTKIQSVQPLATLMMETARCQLPAHTLIDDKTASARALRAYYQNIIKFEFNDTVNFRQLNLITGTITTANIIQTNLPQPVTLNSQQTQSDFNHLIESDLATVYIIENANVFLELMLALPDISFICGNGNNSNQALIQLLQILENRLISLHYLGDLDTDGIQIAETLFQKLNKTDISTFLSIQTMANVNRCVINGKFHSKKRTRQNRFQLAAFQHQADRIHTSGIYVEQEELFDDYCRLIREHTTTTS